jgi:hypothetical protein
MCVGGWCMDQFVLFHSPHTHILQPVSIMKHSKSVETLTDKKKTTVCLRSSTESDASSTESTCILDKPTQISDKKKEPDPPSEHTMQTQESWEDRLYKMRLNRVRLGRIQKMNGTGKSRY